MKRGWRRRWRWRRTRRSRRGKGGIGRGIEEAKVALSQYAKPWQRIISPTSSLEQFANDGTDAVLTPIKPVDSEDMKGSQDSSNPPNSGSLQLQTTMHDILHKISGISRRIKGERGRKRSISIDTSSIADTQGASLYQNPTKSPSFSVQETIPGNRMSRTKSIDINKNAKDSSSKEATGVSFDSSRKDSQITGTLPNHDIHCSPTMSNMKASVGSVNKKRYMPVTEEGKWMESQLHRYDIEVVRESIPTPPKKHQNIMCNLIKAEIKAAVMILALLGSFILCWLPFFIIEIIGILEYDDITVLERRIVLIVKLKRPNASFTGLSVRVETTYSFQLGCSSFSTFAFQFVIFVGRCLSEGLIHDDIEE
ncbi:hypothetical protein PoB_006588600 [Plakobranchus ocellatus]|uniref:Uncharacterized protein n=1 Tax=Plakobranchus ocellatus TaxID=259542 RepID=A0AAV4D5L7_9GAST|nr:hypothetical protein PoB_006588600 [Plakobranchus ocellatus]